MKCFYHKQSEAVGICKSCFKGICASCAVDPGDGLRCLEYCIDADTLSKTLSKTSGDLRQIEGLPPFPLKRSAGPHCSFCGKSREESKHLLAGPAVHICDECVVLCQELLSTGSGQPDGGT